MAEVNVSMRALPGGIVALDLRGHIEKAQAAQVDAAVARLVEQGRNRIIVNCADLAYIASVGISLFLAYLIQIRKAGGDIKFAAMRREVRSVFGVIGLGKLLQIHDTEEGAVREFERQRRDREAKERGREDDGKLAIDLLPAGADVSVARLRGCIDDRQTVETLDEAMRRALDEGRPKLVVNCDRLTYIASVGIGALLGAHPRLRARGGDIRFCHMRDNARTWITMFGLQSMFKVFETEAEAIASYRSGGQ